MPFFYEGYADSLGKGFGTYNFGAIRDCLLLGEWWSTLMKWGVIEFKGSVDDWMKWRDCGP